MKLTTFDGGLNIRQAAHLIAANQGVIYKNIDNSKGHLVSVNDKVIVPGFEEIEVLDYAYHVQLTGETYFTDEPNDYVEYKEVLYKADRVGQPQKRYAPFLFHNLGIARPVGNPVYTANSGDTNEDVIKYALTYYNSADGTESTPLTSGDYASCADGYTITVIPQSSDPQVTHTKIYRLGAALTAYSLVATIADGVTTYNDVLSDTAIPGDLLQTANHAPAPTGLKYLVEYNAMLFGIVGDKLRFTPIGQPDNWREDFYLDLPNTGTGIGKTPIGLLVFTLGKTILITGTGPDTLAQQTISEDQGCVDHDSIANTKGQAVWVSLEGICVSNGNVPEVISKNRLGRQVYSVTNALIYNEAYYAHLTTGEILVFDMAFSDGIIKMLDYDNTVSLTRVNHILYALGDGNVYDLTTGTTKTSLLFKSGWLFEQQLCLPKVHDRVRITYTGAITVFVYVNKILALTKVLSTAKALFVEEFKFSTAFTRGNFVEIEITGTGELFELDFLEESANA